MALSTYDELKASIASWLNRQSLTAQIPDFIGLAEADLNDRLRHQKMILRKTAVLTDVRYPLPTDWLEAHQVTRDGVPIAYMTADSIRALRLAKPGETLPMAFGIWGGNIEVAPNHGGATLEMDYYAKLPALSADNQTNWLLGLRPDAYLYGALVHSAPFLVEDERITVWKAFYDNAVGALNASENSRFSGAPLVRRPRGFRGN